MTTNYIISPVTTYDSDDLLWYTKIALDDLPQHEKIDLIEYELPLYCIVAGKTTTESRSRAENLAKFLTQQSWQLKKPGV